MSIPFYEEYFFDKSNTCPGKNLAKTFLTRVMGEDQFDNISLTTKIIAAYEKLSDHEKWQFSIAMSQIRLYSLLDSTQVNPSRFVKILDFFLALDKQDSTGMFHAIELLSTLAARAILRGEMLGLNNKELAVQLKRVGLGKPMNTHLMTAIVNELPNNPHLLEHLERIPSILMPTPSLYWELVRREVKENPAVMRRLIKAFPGHSIATALFGLTPSPAAVTDKAHRNLIKKDPVVVVHEPLAPARKFWIHLQNEPAP